MISLMIGAPQLLLLLIVPIGVVFFLGYWLGKRSGYAKRVKEENNN